MKERENIYSTEGGPKITIDNLKKQIQQQMCSMLHTPDTRYKSSNAIDDFKTKANKVAK